MVLTGALVRGTLMAVTVKVELEGLELDASAVGDIGDTNFGEGRPAP